MKALKKLVFLGIMLVLCFFQSCKKNSEEATPDIKPESCMSDVNFDMYYQYEYYPTQYSPSDQPSYEKIVCDTMLNDSFMTFEAKEVGASEYEWQIGNEATPRKGKSVTLKFTFRNLQSPTSLNITLTTKFTTEGNCRKYPDNKKTVTRKMHILPETMPAYIGKFRGYDTNFPNQVYDITILNPPPYGIDVIGLANPFYYANDMGGGGGYKTFAIGIRRDLNNCKAFTPYVWGGRCFVYGNNNNKISITYYVRSNNNCTSPNYETKTHTFVGTRIP